MSWNATRIKIKTSKDIAQSKFGDYREYLRVELKRRQNLVPHYSLRDFATDINISPSQLSRVLKGQRGLSKITASKTIRALGIDGYLARRFYLQVSAQSGRSNNERFLASMNLQRPLISKAKSEQKEFCEDSISWSNQIKHFSRFNKGTKLKKRKSLFHRARACGLDPEHFPS